MTALCGWLPDDPRAPGARVVAAMGRALRVHAGQAWAQWSSAGCHVGLLEIAGAAAPPGDCAPAVTEDGRHQLWMAGEVFAAGALAEAVSSTDSRGLPFRRLLLDAILRQGAPALRDLDGEYQIALWDARERVLRLWNDRFGGLPLYWARSPRGFAFAGGVRGVLMAPDVAADPDAAALVEAVTFGGFRLGDRTNVAGVKMLAGGCEMTVRDGAPAARRYWRWADVPGEPARPLPELIDRLHELWRRAVRRRIAGAARPGQTLSGGLDSRAILAEAAPIAPGWTAITYGQPGCDDARYAERAARAMGATWVFHPLYSGRDPDWLERRSGHVQDTDGLIQLVDLMHLEALPIQAGLLDAHLTGYIGDAVSGATFAEVRDARGALAHMPFYGTRLGLDERVALGRIEDLVADLGGAPARYALFEHKLPQSTNRWTAAWRPWVRVRKPFTDYALFDFCQGLPTEVRGRGRLHEGWLRARYPACFSAIPNQRTGLPVLAPPWRLAVERARRLAWRVAQPALAAVGLPARPRRRPYHADEVHWRAPGARGRIEGMILRPDSLVCEILGRAAVGAVVTDWFDRLDGPTQVVGALYVYESYHAGLSHHLREAHKE